MSPDGRYTHIRYIKLNLAIEEEAAESHPASSGRFRESFVFEHKFLAIREKIGQ
jgi:hypothetical protein